MLLRERMVFVISAAAERGAGVTHRRVRNAVAALTVVLGLAAPRDGDACGACYCLADVPFQPPFVRVLPLNARLFFESAATTTTSVTLTRTTSAELVPIEVTPVAPGAKQYWVRPTELLDAHASYVLAWGPTPDAEWRFETGGTLDTEAPTLAAITTSPGGTADYCDRNSGATISTAMLLDQYDLGSSLLLEFEVSGPRGVQRVFRVGSGQADGSYALGASESGCFGNLELLGASPDHIYSARLIAHDWAGNSVSSDAVPLRFETVEPGGCSGMAPAAPAPVAGDSPVPQEPIPTFNDDSAGAGSQSGDDTTTAGCHITSRASSEKSLGAIGFAASVLVWRVRRRRGQVAGAAKPRSRRGREPDRLGATIPVAVTGKSQ
jgi:hypothetical protein